LNYCQLKTLLPTPLVLISNGQCTLVVGLVNPLYVLVVILQPPPIGLLTPPIPTMFHVVVN